jgi:ubiquinone/menaquinone biosynthesis C-methylase UbiE
MKADLKKPQYGNWVSTKLILNGFAVSILLAVTCAILWVSLPGWVLFKSILSLFAALALLSTLYLCLAKYLFSAKGGNVQNKILALLLARTELSGGKEILDIGCGSAALTIQLAQKYVNAHITGVDTWGGSWGYSMQRCKENSRKEGVEARTKFVHASASKLPFNDDSFDLVVSNLTFHEVKDSPNKNDVVCEALRVVKKGGRFVFQDLFLLRACYPSMDELIRILKNSGVESVYFEDTSKAAWIPRVLKLPFMVGTIGMLYGIK